MYKLLRGEVLLVGEGGFSFSCALLDKLEPSLYRHITATSLETDQSIKKHALVERNIAQLREKGLTVELGVDATQLHTHPVFSKQTFDCIVFNFPHAGGKSNHKKNRKLLNDFFASAVQVLSAQGQIIVTLCKGQGGTPADQPMRAWHDSWQVVSMAVNSDLILTQTLPFSIEEYGAYTSTGFRSLDKGFHTENAVTHVFERAARVEVPDAVSDVPVLVNGSQFMCPRYLYKKLGAISHINKTRSHPVHTVFRLLESRVSPKSEAAVESTMWCPLLGGPVTPRNVTPDAESSSLPLDLCQTVTQADADCSRTTSGCDHTDGYSLKLVDQTSVSSIGPHNVLDSLIWDGTEVRKSADPNGFDFVCHPLEAVLPVGQGKETGEVVCSYGPTFRVHQISATELPVEFFMTAVQHLTDNGTKLLSAEHLEEFVTRTTRTFVELFEKVVKDLLDESGTRRSIQVCHQNDVSEGDFIGFRPVACIVLKPIALNSENKPSHGVDMGDRELSRIYVRQTKGDGLTVVCCINLSKLVCALCRIEDDRLLWSMDSPVFDQFVSIQQAWANLDNLIPCEGSGTWNTPHEVDPNIVDNTSDNVSRSLANERLIYNPKHLKPISLYPMVFVHDMSFWESSERPFDENAYCDIIRSVADDNVVSVKLIDSFTEPVHSKKSRCYRLVFTSADCALSYDTSWRLQSLIRLEVQNHMGIILR